MVGQGQAWEFVGTERYRIVRRLGAGGMGVVYEAKDSQTGDHLALKTLPHAADAQALYRLKCEFRALQDIQHPNLVQLGELVEESGTWFFTMELVQGCDFLAYVRSNPPLEATAAAPGLSEGSDCETLETAHIPAPTLPDLAALRRVAGQLASALHALHHQGKVHRDIKPSNVLVTQRERVVLLDFGLATDENLVEVSSGGQIVGTPAYMSPEQAASKTVTAAADWYSFGVLLYESLTGACPHTGNHLEVLMAKQTVVPRPPSELLADVPQDLNELCTALLRYAPSDRPTGGQVLRALGVDGASAPRPPTPRLSHGSSNREFVGRGSEQAILRQAFDDTRDGRAVALRVVGESGIGKSALIRAFNDLIRSELADAVVLEGRCYERELVPYKAVDGVVDALSHYLRSLPALETAALMPRNASLLSSAFPVLARVDAVARSPDPLRPVKDPQERRTRIFAALRELLTRIAERHPIIVFIDDMQWADDDSLFLLRDVMRPPDAPPLLLLCSSRPVDSTRAGSSGTPELPGDVRTVTLRPLSAEDSTELARRRLRAAGITGVSADEIAGESSGHPLYIAELIRHASVVADRSRTRPRLDEAIWQRVQQLQPLPRALVELVALAGAPVMRETLQGATASAASEIDRALSVLNVASMVRGRGAGSRDTVEPYHDRVRQAIVDNLTADARFSAHERLALALEGAGVGATRPELLVRHFSGCERFERAAHYAERAAVQAIEALAFGRAADLYQAALELGQHDPADRRALLTGLGDAQVMAGRLAAAADVYLEAAKGADRATAFELRRKSLEQVLRSSQLERGLDMARDVLADVGVTLPRSRLSAIAGVLVRAFGLKLRGFSFEEVPADQIRGEDQHELDVYWSVCSGLAFADPILGRALQMRYIRRALNSGDTYRIALALSLAMGYRGLDGTRVRSEVDRLAASGMRAALSSGSPHALGVTKFGIGISQFLRGEFAQALDNLTEGLEIMREQTAGARWEIDLSHFIRMSAMVYLGKLADLDRELSVLIDEAVERGDEYLGTGIRAWRSNLVWLIRDQPDEARANVAWARDVLGREGKQFGLQDYYHLLALTQIDLYEGKFEQAQRRLADSRSGLKSSMLLRVQSVSADVGFLRARCWLACARTASPRERARLVKLALRESHRIAREGAAWIEPLSQFIVAGAHVVRQRPEPAIECLRAALSGFETHQMRLHEAVARRALGKLLGDATGAPFTTAASAYFAEQGVANPDAMFRMVAPMFD